MRGCCGVLVRQLCYELAKGGDQQVGKRSCWSGMGSVPVSVEMTCSFVVVAIDLRLGRDENSAMAPLDPVWKKSAGPLFYFPEAYFLET